MDPAKVLGALILTMSAAVWRHLGDDKRQPRKEIKNGFLG